MKDTFDKCKAAIKSLLEKIPDDEVEVSQFGATPGPLQKINRGSDVDSLMFENYPKTDLVAVLDDISKEVDDTMFDRQLIILASDFAHDPPRGKDRSIAAEQHWDAGFNRLRERLLRQFGPQQRAALLLIRAANKPSDSSLVAHITNRLDSSFTDPVLEWLDLRDRAAQDVEVREIARRIERSLTAPPNVVPSLVGSVNRRAVFVEVTNRDCRPLAITSASVGCYLNNHLRDKEVVSFKAPVRLDGTVDLLTEPRDASNQGSAAACWNDRGARFRAEVSTAESNPAFSDYIQAGNTFRILNANALFERTVTRTLVELDVSVVGSTLDPQKQITVSLRSGTQDLGKGTISAPENLSGEPRNMKVMFPEAKALTPAEITQGKVTVTVDSGTNGRPVQTSATSHQTNADGLIGVQSGIAAFITLAAIVWLKRIGLYTEETAKEVRNVTPVLVIGAYMVIQIFLQETAGILKVQHAFLLGRAFNWGVVALFLGVVTRRILIIRLHRKFKQLWADRYRRKDAKVPPKIALQDRWLIASVVLIPLLAVMVMGTVNAVLLVRDSNRVIATPK
jgi:hypothetical protein